MWDHESWEKPVLKQLLLSFTICIRLIVWSKETSPSFFLLFFVWVSNNINKQHVRVYDSGAHNSAPLFFTFVSNDFAKMENCIMWETTRTCWISINIEINELPSSSWFLIIWNIFMEFYNSINWVNGNLRSVNLTSFCEHYFCFYGHCT